MEYTEMILDADHEYDVYREAVAMGEIVPEPFVETTSTYEVDEEDIPF